MSNSEKAVVKGDMFIVDNQERKFGEDVQYILLWAVLPGNVDPRPLLFTEEVVSDAVERANIHSEDVADLGLVLPDNKFDTE